MFSEHQMVLQLLWNFQYRWLLSNTVCSSQIYQMFTQDIRKMTNSDNPRSREGGLEIEYHLSDN